MTAKRKIADAKTPTKPLRRNAAANANPLAAVLDFQLFNVTLGERVHEFFDFLDIHDGNGVLPQPLPRGHLPRHSEA